MTDVTQLAHVHINGADELFVQLVRPIDMSAAVRTVNPPIVRIVWPLQPTILDPKQFPDVAAAIVRMFASASTELARMKARKRAL